MKAMFFNTPGVTAARCSFAAETPTQLVEGDVVRAFVTRGEFKLERRRDRGAAAANHSNLNGFALSQRR